MSLGRKFPVKHPLARVGIFGTPYHGTVESGVLTLPNATTMTYPQPGGAYPDELGTSHLVQVPGVAAISRTTEQQAADDAAGLQWRNKAMLSGGDFQLYGQDLDGWIYIDPDGLRWLVKITSGLSTFFSFSGTLSITVSVSRFGAIGEAVSSSSQTLTLTDWGQQGYPLLQGFVGPDGIRFNETSAALLVESIYSNGSRAALNVHQPILTSSDPGDSTLHHAVRYALGWLQLAITGSGASPTLSLTVLKNRDETLQVIEQTVTNDNTTTEFPALSTGGVGLRAVTGTEEYAFETVRLIAAWPDEVGSTWKFVAERFSDSGGGTGVVTSAGLIYTGVTDSIQTTFVALEFDGVEHSRIETVLRITTDILFESVESGGTFVKLTGTIGDSNRRLSVNGVDYDVIVENTGPPFAEATEGGFVNYNVFTSAGQIYYTYEPIGDLYRSLWRRPLRFNPNADVTAVFADQCRFSGKVFGQRYMITIDGTSSFVYMPRLTPSGSVGSEVTRAYSASERLYAAWCPHTEATVDIQATPVCWV